MKFAGFTPEQKHKVVQTMGYKGKVDNTEMDKFIKSTPGNSSAYDMAMQAAENAVGGMAIKMAEGGDTTTATTTADEDADTTKTPEELAAEAKKENEEKNKAISDMSYKAVSTPKTMASTVTPAKMTEEPDQILDASKGQVGDVTTQATATGVTASQATPPAELTPETISASAVADKTKTALEGTGKIKPGLYRNDQGEIVNEEGLPALVSYNPMNPNQYDNLTLLSEAKPEGGVQAAQGKVSEDAQVTAVKGSLSSTGTDDIDQIDNPTQVVPPPTREIKEGEMISGSAVDMAAVTAATDIQAATADPSKKATVQGQLEGLMQDFEGGATPPWAAGAMRAATAAMAARGLGSSSMAGQAIIQATMESAIPIAQQDASTVASFEAQNLSNRQQTALFAAQQRADFLKLDFTQDFQARVTNAAKVSDIANMNFTADQQVALENARLTQTANLANMSAVNAKVMADAAAMSQMDLTNLSNEQQAAVQNAQNFLQVDMANLNNSQQTSMFKAQAIQQALLTDVAAENAAKQFNATSKNQTNQFMASLNSQVSQFNTTQTNAMNQFNAGETNAISKFNSEMQNQRDQFNATNTLVVAQANAQWRQNISTLNTAAENEANMANAKFENGLTENAINQIWQRERDMMAYAFTAGESLAERNLKIVVADKNLSSVRTQLDASEDAAKSEFMYRFLFS